MRETGGTHKSLCGPVGVNKPYSKFVVMLKKNVRNSFIWERSNALNCIERASLITNFRIGLFLCTSGAAFASHFGLSILIAGMALLVEVIKLERLPLSVRPTLVHQAVWI